jgi:hypothetical protein
MNVEGLQGVTGQQVVLCSVDLIASIGKAAAFEGMPKPD